MPAQWESALEVRGQIFEHFSNYFSIWKITKMLIQGDQKGRCQKYLLISPKLFEPQKYIIHS